MSSEPLALAVRPGGGSARLPASPPGSWAATGRQAGFLPMSQLPSLRDVYTWGVSARGSGGGPHGCCAQDGHCPRASLSAAWVWAGASLWAGTCCRFWRQTDGGRTDAALSLAWRRGPRGIRKAWGQAPPGPRPPRSGTQSLLGVWVRPRLPCAPRWPCSLASRASAVPGGAGSEDGTAVPPPPAVHGKGSARPWPREGHRGAVCSSVEDREQPPRGRSPPGKAKTACFRSDVGQETDTRGRGGGGGGGPSCEGAGDLTLDGGHPVQ